MSNLAIVNSIKDSDEWNSYIKKCKIKSLTQSWNYGLAKQEAEGWAICRYVVYDGHASPIALFQVLFKKIPLIGGICRINKGPLIIHNNKNDEDLSLYAIEAITKKLRKERFWMIQFAPLLGPSIYIDNGLKKIGFKKTKHPPQDSGLISLAENEDEIMLEFKPRVRTNLRKAIRNIHVKSSDNGHDFIDLLLERYNAQQLEKEFEGTSDKMMRALLNNQSDDFKCNILVGYLDEDEPPIGVLLSIQHHDFSEYVVGVFNDIGRKNNVSTLLLWAAMIASKNNGGLWFDVGGLNEFTTSGIARFKNGFRPQLYSLCGEWRKWF